MEEKEVEWGQAPADFRADHAQGDEFHANRLIWCIDLNMNAMAGHVYMKTGNCIICDG